MPASELDVMVYFTGLITEPSPARSFVAFSALGAALGGLIGAIPQPAPQICFFACLGAAAVAGGTAAAVEASAKSDIARPAGANARAARAWLIAWCVLLGVVVVSLVGSVITWSVRA
jgi:hypothetical protein